LMNSHNICSLVTGEAFLDRSFCRGESERQREGEGRGG
jgi:hypothetical protein